VHAREKALDRGRLTDLSYLDACEDIYRPLAETLIAIGLRISEALAPTWDDVDFASRTLRVLRSRTAEGRGSTKGDRFRSVDFGRRLEQVLHALPRAGGTAAPRTLVFRGPRGGELSRSDVSRDLHKHAPEGRGASQHTAPTCAAPRRRRGSPPACR
jgi:integrase